MAKSTPGNDKSETETSKKKADKPAKKSAVKTGLEEMQSVLDYVGYKSYLMPKNRENPVEQLFVALNEDEDEKDDKDSPMLQIMFVSDLVENSKADPDNETFLLQFFVGLPVTPMLDLDRERDLHELLSLFSKIIPIGHFGYTAEEGISFRYSLMTPSRKVPDNMLLEIVQMVQYFVENFSAKIKTFTTSDISIEEIMDDA